MRCRQGPGDAGGTGSRAFPQVAAVDHDDSNLKWQETMMGRVFMHVSWDSAQGTLKNWPSPIGKSSFNLVPFAVSGL